MKLLYIMYMHLICCLLCVEYAYCHGFVYKVTIDSKTYAGNIPTQNDNPSVIRLINDPNPVKGATNPDVNCGHGAQRAELTADANPGSKLAFDWRMANLSSVCTVSGICSS